MKVDETNFISYMKRKNTKGIDYIVDNYSNLIFTVVNSILNTSFYSEYTEECVNDVFLAVWNNIDSFDLEKGNFRNWIIAIAKYKAIDYKRKLFKQSTDKVVNENLVSDNLTPEETIILDENKAELMEVINVLNNKDKEIFIRRYFLCESIESIARIFKVNRNLVDQRLSRGRKFLKKKLLDSKKEVI